MSQENVEIVRSIYEAVNRRDAVTPFEFYAEDIVWDLSKSGRWIWGPKSTYHGHDGVREFWRDNLEVFREIDFEVAELVDAGDKVLATIHETEVGRASGVAVSATRFDVFTLAAGKVTQLQSFADRRQALEAAGLSE